MEVDVDTLNRFAVAGSLNDRVQICNPPFGPLDKEAALNLAAYLVAMADPTRERFEEVFKAIMAV